MEKEIPEVADRQGRVQTPARVLTATAHPQAAWVQPGARLGGRE